VLTVDQYPKWFSTRGGVNDLGIIKAALKVMEQADLLVAHYGDKFDRRFFQGRCAIHNLPPPPPTKQRDTWRICKVAFSLSSNRLGNVAMALGLPEQKHQKTREEWPGWWFRAMSGDRTAVRDMAKYCAQDVRTLEQIYLRVRVYDNQHPRMQTTACQHDCPLCGGPVIYKGYCVSIEYRYKRWQCKQCGRWGRDRIREK